MKEGFLHIPLDEASSFMTTMHTSYGRHRWTRLPFGIASASEEFQLRLLNALEGLDGIVVKADDLLVYGEGETYEEAEKYHDKHMIALMERAKSSNIKFNANKLQFKLREIKFVGHIFTDKGMKADPDKISAIVDMPAPRDKTSLQRFIGLTNYLSPYCKNLSNTIRPLTNLTKLNVPYDWSTTQETAFQNAKQLIVDAPVLQYYDLPKPVTLQVDASQCGLGGALLQPNQEGELQPVAYILHAALQTRNRGTLKLKKNASQYVILSQNLTTGCMENPILWYTPTTSHWRQS